MMNRFAPIEQIACVKYLVPNPAVVELSGPDAKTFLHRISTNEIDAPINILLTPKGRIVEVVHQYSPSEESILLFCSPGQAQKVIAYFDGFLFTERVSLKDRSADFAHAIVIGNFEPQKQGIWIKSFDFKDLSGNHLPSFVVSPPPELPTISQAEYDSLRIMSCVAGYPGEFNESFNPLELGLEQAISWDKGCYVGQEVISRIETYQKSKKVLQQIFEGDQTPPTTKAPKPLPNGAIGLGIASIRPIDSKTTSD